MVVVMKPNASKEDIAKLAAELEQSQHHGRTRLQHLGPGGRHHCRGYGQNYD